MLKHNIYLDQAERAWILGAEYRIIYFLLDILKYNIVIVDPDKTDVKQVDDTTCIVLSSLHNLSSSFTLFSLLNNNKTQKAVIKAIIQ